MIEIRRDEWKVLETTSEQITLSWKALDLRFTVTYKGQVRVWYDDSDSYPVLDIDTHIALLQEVRIIAENYFDPSTSWVEDTTYLSGEMVQKKRNALQRQGYEIE
jgi:hypothetical protein